MLHFKIPDNLYYVAEVVKIVGQTATLMCRVHLGYT